MSESELQHKSPEEVWKILKQLKKQSWYDRQRTTQIKTEKQFFSLYKAICYAGLHRDERYPEVSGLTDLLLKYDFGNSPRRFSLNRGDSQSFTYRFNRITENANNFIYDLKRVKEVYAYKNIKIDFIFTVYKGPNELRMSSYNSKKIGCVIAGNHEDAVNIANMLYAPFFQNDTEVLAVASNYNCPILKENKAYFFKSMSEIIQENNKKIVELKDSIKKLETDIEDYNNVNICINLNSAAYAD